ncbi:MAG TPA: hypothetical protein VKU36_02700 [Candidatus Babeliales bacterium]|nr:hypothetical protein [Candidatus Babeliales bacterium]
MKTIRIFLLLSVFSLSFSVTTYLHASLNIRTWQTTHLNTMSPEELQLIANFLYLSYAASLAELKVRQFSIPLSRLHQSIKQNVTTYQDCSQELATIKTLLDRLGFVVGTRTIYAETLKVFNQYYNEHATQLVDAALEGVQLDAQEQLRVWADEQKEQTSTQLKKISETISTNVPQLQGAAELHNIMSKGKLPQEWQLTEENVPFTSILILDTILKSNHKLQIIIDDITNSLNETTDYAEHIITIGADIYKSYYMTVRHILLSPTVDKKYATTMFGMHDLLPDEYKTALPDADHVFEHMLQTAKLYTQAELLPKTIN